MDALILSCGTGGGHNSARAAIEQELSARGHRVKTLNPYLLKGEKLADAVNNAYIFLVQKTPSTFGMIYRLGDAYRKLHVPSPVFYINRLMAPLLEKYVLENNFDAIVTTHLFPGEILANMKRSKMAVPKTYYIATDYTCIPFTEETDCDYYIIPSPGLTDEFVSNGIPREKILPYGIPLRREFCEKEDRFESRLRLGLDPDKKYILISGGSIGAGQIEKAVPILLDHFGGAAECIVVCGSNQSLYEHLSQTYSQKCTVLSYTPQMADYMRACDLFLTKPGGLSSTEAAVIGTALIHINPIPGCETRNMQFFEQHGMCAAVHSLEDQLADACDRLLEEGARQQMYENQHKMIPANAASTLCDLMESDRQKAEMAG